MGDIFQFEWIESMAGELKGPVLEIGSKRYGGPPVFFDYRTVFPSGFRYLGVDLEPGDGVDLVLDMTYDFERIEEQLSGELFGSIICLSVLEHVRDPFAFARNLSTLLNEDGTAVLSVPFSWGFHAYPDDYWRFTPNGIRHLFPDLKFDDQTSWLHTCSGRKVRLDCAVDYNRFISGAGRNGDVEEGFPGIIENTMCDMVGHKRSVRVPGVAGKVRLRG